MRIALLQNMLWVPTLGGANKANRALLEGLARRGHDCHALVPALGNTGASDRAGFHAALAARGHEPEAVEPGVDRFRAAGVTVDAVAERARLGSYVAERLRALAPDWVLVSCDDPGQELLEVALSVTARVVYLVHTPLYMPFGPQCYAASERSTERVRQCAGIVTVSEAIRDYIREASGLASEVLAFPVYGEGPFPWLARFDAGYVTLVNPCDYKGLPIFLELARRLPEVAFAAVPTWGTTSADRERLAALPNVTLLPPADDIGEIMAQTRVLLMPSLWTEAFPLLPVEAMLRAIPVLASDVPGLREAKLGVEAVLPVRPIERYEARCDERRNPIAVVPEQNVAPWEAALTELLGDRGRYEAVAAASAEAARRFVAGVSVEPFERYLGSLVPRFEVAPPSSAPVAPAATPTPSSPAAAPALEERSRDARTLLALKALQARKQAAASGRPSGPEPIPRRAEREIAPLSYEQERLWFLDQLEPGNAAYNEASAVRLRGELDRSALAAALAEVVARHEVLRTVFELVDGTPRQRVQPSAVIPLGETDLRARPAQEVAARVEAEALAPFDLARGPLLRAHLFREDDRSWVLSVVSHHIVSDAWSMGVFIRELATLYAAFRAGGASPLPPLAIQYGDYAQWQRQELAGERLEQALAYWRGRLAEAPSVLDLPTDRPRPAQPSGHGGRTVLALPLPLARALRELASTTGTTLFMVLLAGFNAWLGRLTGQRDLCLGTDLANRGRSETEPLIGFFVNQLVLRTELAGDPSFRTLLERVRERTLEAFAHQAAPFAKVVEAVQPERDLARTPLFQAIFALQNAPVADLELPGLRLEPFERETTLAKFDLVVWLVEAGEVLKGVIEHSSDLFDATTVERWARQIVRTLASAVGDPARRVSELEVLGAAERHQLLVEWNDRAHRTPPDSFVELLRAQAAARPGAPAASEPGRVWSYGELAEHARRVAAAVRATGVATGSLVALLAPRGLDFLAAMVGLFEAGCAYVPLDPEHPPRRLAQVLGDSAAPLVLVASAFGERLEEALGELEAPPRRLSLEAALAGDPAPHPAPPLPGRALAYVLYTSGSTGAPKGAMVEHQGMTNHLWAKVLELGLGPSDVLAQTASQCFDISVWQFLAALVVGGRVHVLPDEETHDPEALLAAIDREGLTIFETVPSMLRLMIEESERRGAGRAALHPVRWLIPTGEALPPELVRRFLALYPRVPLLNAYGPTECSDDVTHQPLPQPLPADAATTPIGRPVTNMALYAVGPRLEPVPLGARGELCVGGVGVGRGYWADPRRSALAFVPDPFAGRPGARLYRTGDLGRWLADGRLEFLGRLDHQVKVRGFRIELAEIEAVLASHPAVAQTVVVARGDGGDARLAAYVVERGSARESAELGADLERVKLDQWRSIFDEVYREGDTLAVDPAVNLRVWVDSSSGEALPAAEILECVEDTVERLRALAPSRVLEIGCGTGLLLERLAPSCRAYWGTDLSGEVLAALAERVAPLRRRLTELRLLERDAASLEGIPDASFDLVVLNEVAQYFPSPDYLVTVLEAALAKVAPGGALFVGGVRHHGLLDAFHATVQLAQAPAELARPELVRRLRTARTREKELLVEPDLFELLRRSHPEIGSLVLQLKGGWADNELTRFRYDVLLAKRAPAPRELRWLDWERHGLDLARLEAELTAHPGGFGVTGIPNARLVAAEALLVDLGEVASTGAATVAVASAVAPAELWALARRHGCEAQVRFAVGSPYRIDVAFVAPAERWTELVWPGRPAPRARPWSQLGNDPLQGLFAERLVPALRQHLAERLPECMVPAAFVLLPELPLSSNGKVDRKALPVPGEERRAGAGAVVPPRNAVEARLATLWAEALRLESVGVHDNFFRLGGDSILSIQIVARAKQLGLAFTPWQMFRYQTIAELAEVIGESSVEPAEQGEVVGPVALTPIQRWFFDQVGVAPSRYNFAGFFAVRGALDAHALGAALGALLRHHDALRLRFERGDDGAWRQELRPWDGAVPLAHVDLRACSAAELPTALAAAVEREQAGFDLEAGALLRAALFDLPQGEQRLLVLAHHLASDGVSWRLVLEDLETAYGSAAAGVPIELPPKTTSVARWSELLAALEPSARERERWLALGEAAREPLPLDFPGGREANLEGTVERWVGSLSPAVTRALLQGSGDGPRRSVNAALLTALAQALARWGAGPTLVELEVHGRDALDERVDVSRTVGWLSTQYPVLLEAAAHGTSAAEEALREQLELVLASVPHGGAGYLALRYGDPEAAVRLPQAEISFNYLGQAGADDAAAAALLVPAPEPAGARRDPSERRPYLFEIDCLVVEGGLRVEWAFSPRCHRPATVQRLGSDFLGALERLADARPSAPEAPSAAPTDDLAALAISQQDLDLLVSRLGG